MKVILLSGKQGSGKTTLQQDLLKHLIVERGRETRTMNFADPLYELHNYCLKRMESWGIVRDIKKDGPLLQVLGTEWGRKTIDENIWVKICKNKCAEEMVRGTNYVIIGDCRFENEFEAFPDALRVRLTAPMEVRKARCEMWRDNDQHPSEIGLDRYENLGVFDLLFDTNVHSTEFIIEKIAEKLGETDGTTSK